MNYPLATNSSSFVILLHTVALNYLKYLKDLFFLVFKYSSYAYADTEYTEICKKWTSPLPVRTRGTITAFRNSEYTEVYRDWVKQWKKLLYIGIGHG